MVKFPWRSIWHSKVAWDVALFLFAQQPWRKLLPRIIWLNRISFYWIGVTCLCNCSGKTTKYCLLIHSTVAKDLWSFLFMLLGDKWVTSWQVVFFFFWQGMFERNRNAAIQSMPCLAYVKCLDKEKQLYL